MKILGKKKSELDDETAVELQHQHCTPKYQKPKILLLDLDEDVQEVLTSDGFNVEAGSFGRPYKVAKKDAFTPVICNGELPKFLQEQEILVVDLKPKTLVDISGEKHTTPAEKDWWVSCSRGEVDPRPRLMAIAQDKLDTVLKHGGIFIVFASPRYEQEFKWATDGQIQALCMGWQDGYNAKSIDFDNWSFLSLLEPSSGLKIDLVTGREININKEINFGGLLEKHLDHAHFECTFQPSAVLSRRWLTIATDKFERPVSGALMAQDEGAGMVFLFPQVRDKAAFLSEFFREYLPNIMPPLFPEFERGNWIHRPSYELPKITQVLEEIRRVEEQSRSQIETLRQQIERERLEKSFLYDLVRATGDDLVAAVIKALKLVGFELVVDVDESLKQQGVHNSRDEDLQIHDGSPVLLVEVKGVGGIPHDEEALAVEKYVPTRMREWKRTDVTGLTIINHQRHLPGLERQQKPFRDKIIENAEARSIGLLTTWDLYRLARGVLKNGWKPDHLKPLFYRSGPIEPVPAHYELVGTIEGFLDRIGVAGVKVEGSGLWSGDTIAFELPLDFEEQEATSLQINGVAVEVALAGTTVGIKTHLSKEQAKKGVRVFRVQATEMKALPAPPPSLETALLEDQEGC